MKKLVLAFIFFACSCFAQENKFEVDDFDFSWEYKQIGDLKLVIIANQDSIYTQIQGKGSGFSSSIMLSKSQIPQLIKALLLAYEKGEKTKGNDFTVEVSNNDGNKTAYIRSDIMSNIHFSPKKLDDLAEALKDANERMEFIRSKLTFD